MPLKYIHINEKKFKKQLLISHQKVATLQNFLKDLIKDEVLIINTNLGLEIYYISEYDCTNIIKDTFGIVACKHCTNLDHYRFFSFQNEREIQPFMKASMQKLAGMPLFKSYTKSMLHQLDQYFNSNKILIGRLLRLWHEVSRELRLKDLHNEKIQVFKSKFQTVYINNVENDVLKELLMKVLDKKHVN